MQPQAGDWTSLNLSPHLHNWLFSSVQFFSHVRFFATLWTAACHASLFITISWSLFKLMSIKLVMPSNHLILCRPLLFLPSIFPSIRVFSNESALCMRWPKYWSFSISPFNEYSGLISFRIAWFDLLAVQGSLESFLQHHSSKASVLQCSAFFMVQPIILIKTEISAYKFDCCCYSVAKLCLTLCDIMGCGTPGSSALHCCLEFA